MRTSERKKKGKVLLTAQSRDPPASASLSQESQIPEHHRNVVILLWTSCRTRGCLCIVQPINPQPQYLSADSAYISLWHIIS